MDSQKTAVESVLAADGVMTGADATGTDTHAHERSVPRQCQQRKVAPSVAGQESVLVSASTPQAIVTSANLTTFAPASIEAKKKSKPKNKLTYAEMIQEAIIAINDRTGSSLIAINRYLHAHYSDIVKPNDNAVRARINAALKAGLSQGRFQKHRASYKVNVEWLRKHKAQVKKRESAKAKRAAAQKAVKREAAAKQKAAEKHMELESIKKKLSPKEYEQRRKILKKEEDRQRRRRETEALKARRAERLRKRRFPMEDTALHEEDKELGVKPPPSVKRRPNLPYIWSLVQRHTANKSAASSYSKGEWLEYDTRGLASDVLQVYHFFSGDVSYRPNPNQPAVPSELTLPHLLYAVDEVLSGNARKCRLVPPILSHLFVLSLQLLTNKLANGTDGDIQTNPRDQQRQKDMLALFSGLSAVSWADTCFLYMDSMERFSTTRYSADQSVLPPGHTDIAFLMKVKDMPITSQSQTCVDELPQGYSAYLGHHQSALAKGHAKLLRSDPWNLTAEELMALLRALTDDVLADRKDLALELEQRNEDMHELLRAKRAADSEYRRIRLAYQGPVKMQHKIKAAAAASDDADSGEMSEHDEALERDVQQVTTSKRVGVKESLAKRALKWKPTATKRQFDVAESSRRRANEAYENGMQNLVARTCPVGTDRSFNRFYLSHKEPSMVFVEQLRTPSGVADYLPSDVQMNRTSWHVVNNREMFDELQASLDSRGKRELDLKGRFSQNNPVVSGLRDDAKESSAKAERKRVRGGLEEKRQELFLACKREAEMSRRSRRNQTTTESELKEVEKKIAALDEEITRDETPVIVSYEELTGLELLRQFDLCMERSPRQPRRGRGQKVDVKGSANTVIDLPCCSALWPSPRSKKTGIVGLMVAELLRVENLCQSLCPLVEDTRRKWRERLESLSEAWNRGNPPFVGPPSRGAEDGSGCNEPCEGSRLCGTSTTSRRRRPDICFEGETLSSVSQVTPQAVIASMRKPLLDLEARIYNAMGSCMADEDSQTADDNMSTAEESKDSQVDDGAAELRRDVPWKRLLNELSHTPAKRYSQVRKIVEDAMREARIARRPAAVSRLRAALLLHHPNAAGECKTTALGVLDEFGGYNPADDVVEDETEDGEADEDEDEDFPSMLSSEAMMITGSLGGSDMANRVDWTDAVRDAKTLSRFGSLLHSFCRNARVQLDTMKTEKDRLSKCMELWKKEEERKKRFRNGQPRGRQSPSSVSVSPEVWADVKYLDEFCVVKLEGLWWPARKCEAKELSVEDQLRRLSRRLVSVIGERGSLRAIREIDTKKFSVGANDEEVVKKQSKELRNQLDECMTMTRRILRGSERNSVRPE